MDKKDKLRMCIDYHALNKITIRNNYHVFHIDDLLDGFNGAKYFKVQSEVDAIEHILVEIESIFQARQTCPKGKKYLVK